MISSGRSFNFSAPCHRGSCLQTGSRRPRTLPSARCEPTWRTMPPIRRRVDRAGRLDRAAGGLLDLLDDRRGLVVRELVRGRELDRQAVLRRRRRAPRTRGRSRRARRTSLLRERGGRSCGRARRRRRGSRRAPPAARRGSICGFERRPRSSGTSSSAAANVAELGVDRLERARPPAPPRRARGRTCGARRPARPVPSPARRSRARRSPRRSARWSSASSTLPVTSRSRSSVEVGDLGADLLERALRLGLDLLARLLEPALALGLGLLLRALDLRVGDLARLREDRPRHRPSPGRSAAVLLEQLAGLVAGVVGLLDRARIRSRRSSIVFWIGPNANRLRTKNVIAKRSASRSSDPGRPRSAARLRRAASVSVPSQTRTYASRPPMRP